MRAVEAACLLPEPGQKEPAVLDPIPENARPGCGADGAARAGVRENRNQRNQICKCRSCKFSADAGFGGPDPAAAGAETPDRQRRAPAASGFGPRGSDGIERRAIALNLNMRAAAP